MTELKKLQEMLDEASGITANLEDQCAQLGLRTRPMVPGIINQSVGTCIDSLYRLDKRTNKLRHMLNVRTSIDYRSAEATRLMDQIRGRSLVRPHTNSTAKLIMCKVVVAYRRWAKGTEELATSVAENTPDESLASYLFLPLKDKTRAGFGDVLAAEFGEPQYRWIDFERLATETHRLEEIAFAVLGTDWAQDWTKTYRTIYDPHYVALMNSESNENV